MKKLWSLIIVAFVLLGLTVYGGQAQGLWNRGEHTIEAIWKLVYPSRMDVGNNVDIDIKSGGEIDVESGGELDINSGGALDVNGSADFTGSTITATGLITATHIEDYTDEWFTLNMTDAMVDSTGPITSSSSPNLVTRDNIYAALYDGSGETTGLLWTRRVPDRMVVDGSGGIIVYLLVSSGTRSTNRTFNDLAVDWSIWVNRDGVAFDSATYAQSTVTCGTSSEMDLSNEVLTLQASSTAIGGIQAGDWVTIEIFNASTSSLTGNEDDLEIKGGSVIAKFKH